MGLTVILYGKLSLVCGDARPDDFASALRRMDHRVISVGTGGTTGPGDMRTSFAFDQLARRTERATIVAFVNGYSAMDPSRPYGLNGENDGLQSFMQRVIAVGNAAPQHPLDIYLRMHQRPKILNKYVDQLPRGSVLTAFRSPTGDLEDEDFWKLISNRKLYENQSLSARALLRWSIVSGMYSAGMPLAAVSGAPRLRPSQVWDQFGRLSKIPDNAIESLLQDCAVLPHIQCGDLALALSDSLPHKIDNEDSPIAYSIALESVWDELLVVKQPTAASASPVIEAKSSFNAAAPAAQAAKVDDTTPGQNTGSKGRATRLAAHDVARLPEWLRRTAAGNPMLVRRLKLIR